MAVVEDNGRVGGVGSVLGQVLADAGVGVPVQTYGLPQEFLDQGKREDLLAAAGLNAQDLARSIVESVAKSAGPVRSAVATTDRRPGRPVDLTNLPAS